MNLMGNKSSLTLLLILLIPWKAISQKNVVSKDGDVAKLSLYLENHVKEVSYLQFDKPYYAAGDTIYFKAYVTAGEKHKLSSISGVLHVDLINAAGKIDQSIKLQLYDGLTWGDFALPDSLPTSSYRIRAYTQWMRNFGDSSFFERVVPVVSLKKLKVPESGVIKPGSILKPDIQFMPEGGSLVAGIKTKVAFKAIGATGLGTDVSGVVIDNNHKQVATFVSAHLGIGYFYFSPEEGKTYSAKVKYPDGLQDEVSLPAPEREGISLAINNDFLPKATVIISANDSWFRGHKGDAYTLLIYSGGLISTVDCKLDSAVTRLDILKRKLRTGVATVTLFSPDGEPLCERLFFVQNYDALALNAVSDKELYTKREKATFKLKVVDRRGEAAEGYFSASVINESLAPDGNADNDNILSYLLLTSDLKGHIEQPGYYFSDTSSIVRANLDLVMLTHGYRNFQWKEVLDTAKRTSPYQPETGINISGRVDDLSGKPIDHGSINLLPTNGGQLLSVMTDHNGVFHFPPLTFTDTAKFILSAVNAKGKDLTKITCFDYRLSQPMVEQSQAKSGMHFNEMAMRQYLEADSLHRGYFGYDHRKNIMLKEVIVKDKKIEPIKIDPVYGFADQTIRGDEIEYGGSLAVRLMGKLHGIHFVQRGMRFIPVSNTLTGRVLIVVDGSEMPADFDISSINTGSIESIELMNNATVITPEHGPVIVINTLHGLQPKDMISTGVLPITVMGFYKARQFYSPKYDTPAALSSKQRDLRSTIYWNPEIKTDKDGNVSFEYYNADGVGTYKVTIEGIDKDGNIGRQVYRYEVK